MSSEAPDSKNDIQYWFKQCREETLNGYHNSKMAYPIWILLHPHNMKPEVDLQTLIIFAEDDTDDYIIDFVKKATEELKIHAVFSCSPGTDDHENKVFLFLEESLHNRRDQAYKVILQNQTFNLGPEIEIKSPNYPLFFNRNKEDLN